MRTIHIQLNKQKWKMQFKPLHETLHGECDTEKRIISINSMLPPSQRLEIMLHELLHAVYPFLEEDTVDNAAIDIAKALRKCGINSIGDTPSAQKKDTKKDETKPL